MRIATIDIGTNTTLLLVAERTPKGVVIPLAERAEITRLGRGIGGDGLLRDENIALTLKVLKDYAREAQAWQAPVFAIGTEGLRRAPNAKAFLEQATAILGTEVEVISGDREAHLSFLAAQRSFQAEAEGDVVVIDIGGGSTEIIVAKAKSIFYRRSLPLGSVRLTEAFIHSDPPSDGDASRLCAHIRHALDAVPDRKSVV
jgi:exopolyphosphatase/guanosine-5'-triphosphate,3'-diphosphate pyrophosphatase